MVVFVQTVIPVWVGVIVCQVKKHLSKFKLNNNDQCSMGKQDIKKTIKILSPSPFLTIAMFRHPLYYWTVKKKAIPKDVVVSDSSPFFDRNSRCFKARNTRTNLRHGKLSPIVVSFGIVAFAFLETDVKQCRHINGIRDILLLWVPLQHLLQLLEKSNYYHCNDWETNIYLLGLTFWLPRLTWNCCFRWSLRTMVS